MPKTTVHGGASNAALPEQVAEEDIRPSESIPIVERPDIREWARLNGFQVSDKGRVAKSIQDAYAEAMS